MGAENESLPAVGALASRDIDTGLDWSQCRRLGRPSDFELTTTAPLTAPQVIDVEADSALFDKAENRAVLQGEVLLDDGAQTLQADQLVYDREQDLVTATGRVLLIRPEVRLAGDSATLDLTTEQGRIESAAYRVPAINARGDADVVQVSGDRVSRYENINFTTCRPGTDDWYLSAGQLELDHSEGLGTATGAKLRFFDVPLAYLPQLTFPIDDRRRSGVLIPWAGYSESVGAAVAVPYYLNLAPNYDATLTPRLMSRRGFALGTEFRFLSEHYQGEVFTNILPHDPAFENGKARGELAFETKAQWTSRFEGRADINYASDSAYLEDLGDSLAATSSRQLERVGELQYHGRAWDLLGRVQHFQTLDRAIERENRPYSRLPQVLFNYDRPAAIAGLHGQMTAEYVNFWKQDSLKGHRVDIYPSVSLPLRRPWGYLEPKLQARYTAYRLADEDRAGLTDDSPDRLLGIASLDAGLYFDRRMSWFDGTVRQTLEPRMFYLYVPRDKQDDLPVFDTTELDFNFDNLFRDNRFNGADRHGDANQVTLALVSRVLDVDSGAERLRAALGQIYFFEDRTVTLADASKSTDDTSALVAELTTRLTQAWQARTGIQWDPNDDEIDQGLAQVSYRDADQRVFNAAYRFRDEVIEQTDLAFLWPVSETTRLIGRWYYSLQNDRTLEAVGGIEYGRCCWQVRALIRRFTDDEGDSHNLAFWLQLELNGLGRIGTNVEEFLDRGVYGYRTDDY